MLDLRPDDILHKSYLHRLLLEIVDQPRLAQSLVFKGGTCAAMLGYLDRFSIDLGFDVLKGADKEALRKAFRQVFDQQGLGVMLEFENALFFQIRYPNSPGKRNSLKISASDIHTEANQYKAQYFKEIDRFIISQTIDTMFANKLVAVTDRYAQYRTVAGRDIYDIHHFWVSGHDYRREVIIERTGLSLVEYFSWLIVFVQEHFSQRVIDEDLNTLLPYQQFRQIRKILMPETLSMLARELKKLSSSGESL